MAHKNPDRMTISMSLPKSSWLALTTAAAVTGLPKKIYLAYYLAQAMPVNRPEALLWAEAEGLVTSSGEGSS